MTALRITRDSTAAELREALTNISRRAQREFPVVGTAEMPTPWDERHAAIDGLLDALEMLG